MLDFNIELKGMDNGENLTNDKLKKVLMKSMFKMEELAIDSAPFDQGLLRAGITLFPQILANKYVLVSNTNYSASIEYGSRPFYAPIQPLKEWARRKLGDENIAYAVQAKIAKVGITASPFFRPALSQVQTYWLPQYMAESFY